AGPAAQAVPARNTRKKPTALVQSVAWSTPSFTMIQIRFLKLIPLLLLSSSAFAAELELRYSALERILAEQLFTVDGRHYVRGNPSTRCQFAFLEKPHIDSERFDKDQFRLRVKARFSGRSAFDLL